MANRKTLAERLRSASPAHPEETEGYRRFNSTFSLISLLFVIVFAYAMCFLPGLESVAAKIGANIPLTKARLSFLSVSDANSYLAYSATLVSTAISIPLTVAIFSLGFWRTVAVPRKCRPVSKYSALTILFGVSTATVLMAIAFIDVPEAYDPRWPGLARILFWPIFPALGAGVSWIFGINIFLMIVGIMKAVLQYGGKYGGRK